MIVFRRILVRADPHPRTLLPADNLSFPFFIYLFTIITSSFFLTLILVLFPPPLFLRFWPLPVPSRHKQLKKALLVSEGFVCIKPFLALGKTMHAVRCAIGVFNPIQVPTDFGVDPYGALDTENMSRGEGGGSRSITRSPVSGNILLRGSVEDWAGYFAGWVLRRLRYCAARTRASVATAARLNITLPESVHVLWERR